MSNTRLDVALSRSLVLGLVLGGFGVRDVWKTYRNVSVVPMLYRLFLLEDFYFEKSFHHLHSCLRRYTE